MWCCQDISTLENMHCSKLFKILRKKECNIFSELSEAHRFEQIGMGGGVGVGTPFSVGQRGIEKKPTICGVT